MEEIWDQKLSKNFEKRYQNLHNWSVYRVGQIKWHHFTFLLVTN